MKIKALILVIWLTFISAQNLKDFNVGLDNFGFSSIPSDLILKDIDNNGTTDIVTFGSCTDYNTMENYKGVLIWYSDGFGNWKFESIEDNSEIIGVHVGEFDGDEVKDIIVLQKIDNNLGMHLLKGTGNSFSRTNYSEIDLQLSGEVKLKDGDFDSDGDYDLVIQDKDNILVYENRNGHFSKAWGVNGRFSGNLEVIDMNLDGHLDILSVNNGFVSYLYDEDFYFIKKQLNSDVTNFKLNPSKNRIITQSSENNRLNIYTLDNYDFKQNIDGDVTYFSIGDVVNSTVPEVLTYNDKLLKIFTKDEDEKHNLLDTYEINSLKGAIFKTGGDVNFDGKDDLFIFTKQTKGQFVTIETNVISCISFENRDRGLSIDIEYPNGSEVFKDGVRTKVSYKSSVPSYILNKHVNLYLYEESSSSEPILLAEKLSPSGIFDWKIDIGETSNNYKIKAELVTPSDTLITFSQSTFSVEAANEEVVETTNDVHTNKDFIVKANERGISFNLDEPRFVTLKIYNLRGQLIDIPVSNLLSAGDQFISWKTERLSRGAYIYNLYVDKKQFSGKFVHFGE